MNAFKVTYTDGTHYTTSANGTLSEFTAYLLQFGRIVVDENPVTGKETKREIEKVELLPDVGHVYAFQYYNEIKPLVVTHVNDTHVFYKFPDDNGGNMEYCRSYPMILEIWESSAGGRAFIGTTADPDAILFLR